MRLFTLMQTAYNNFDDTVNNYLGRVFDSIGLNSNHSQIFTLIFDGVKGIMQNAMFYIEDALTEQNIFTALRKKSVYSLAKQSGYEPFYGSAASGTLKGTVIRGALLDSDATKIFIPNNAVIINRETKSRYILQLNSNDHVIDITKPLVSHEFKITEGIRQINYFTAKGTNFEVFSISGGQSLFDKSNVKVYVNGVQFLEAASMYDMNEGYNEYVISIGYDATFEIMFGDGIYGNKLNQGDSVQIEWIAHNGSKGNVMGTSTTDFVFETVGHDTYGNEININKFMKLTMLNCVSGGTDSDSIQTIRNMVGYNSRSLILATEENFHLFLKRFSFIGRVNCWSHENTMQVIVSCLSNKITDVQNTNEYFGLDKDELLINSDQREQILTALTSSNRTFAGITIQFKDPKIWRYAAVCVIRLKDNYNRESIKEDLKQTIGTYFMNLSDNVEIIYRSDIIKTVLNEHSEALLSFDIQFVSEKNEEAYKNGFYNVAGITYKNGMLIDDNIKKIYSDEQPAGLDEYGNIIIESKLEIPILQGGFAYYGNKEINDKSTCIRIETMQFVFV